MCYDDTQSSAWILLLLLGFLLVFHGDLSLPEVGVFKGVPEFSLHCLSSIFRHFELLIIPLAYLSLLIISIVTSYTGVPDVGVLAEISMFANY